MGEHVLEAPDFALSLSQSKTATDQAAARPIEIVIVGGGAAGLELASRLGSTLGRKKKANVTLIEKKRTHLWKPLLHAVAAGSIDPGEQELNYLAQAYWRNFQYKFGQMTGLDRVQKKVQIAATYDDEDQLITPLRDISYDILVIAIGSITNDFGTPGVAEFAIPLETAEQAIRFNRRLVNGLIHADTQTDPLTQGQLHVAIIGAGATGTELAAELHRTSRQVVAYGLDRVNVERDIKIILIEGASRVLPSLPDKVGQAALDVLHKLGILVKTGAFVSEVTPEGVHLQSGEFIPARLTVWAAGVKAPDFLHELDGLETNKINQIITSQTLQTTRDPDIFAIGDCAACPRPGFDQAVPPRAQAAHQQASHLVKQLQQHIEGKMLEPFHYRDFGSLVSFGNYSTVGNLMGFLSGRSLFIEGYFARMVYRSLHLMHEIALYGTIKALLRSLGRRISRSAEPTVKLH